MKRRKSLWGAYLQHFCESFSKTTAWVETHTRCGNQLEASTR
jgi:hypothetical protein